MPDLCFNKESDCSEENIRGNKNFRSAILQPFQFEPEQIKKCGNESHEGETKYIHAPAADLFMLTRKNFDFLVTMIYYILE